MIDLLRDTHLLVIAGSRAYGLHTAESDIDVKGLAVPPPRVLHGFLHRFEQVDDPAGLAPLAASLTDAERAIVKRTKLEGSVYALAKFVRLAADANPHVLDALFGREQEVRIATPIGRVLRERRDLFLSQRARDSFGGYAIAQLKRIRTHRRWLLEPPTRAPERADYDLPERTLIPQDQLTAAAAAVQAQLDRWNPDLEALPPSEAHRIREQLEQVLTEQLQADRFILAARTVGLTENFIALMDRERRYRAAHGEFRRYQHWLRTRNPDRAALEAAHGYDTKHAAHLVRLLRMALEIVRTGQVHVWRGDRDGEELRAIRAGAWTYDALESFADQATAALAEESARCPLPRRPDLDVLDALCAELTERAWRAEPGMDPREVESMS